MLIHLKVLVGIIKVSTRVVEEADKELIEVARRVTHPFYVRGRTVDYLPTVGWQMFWKNWQEDVQWSSRFFLASWKVA